MRKHQEIERYLTVDELSRKTGLSPGFIRKAKKQFGLPHYFFGKLLKFKESEFLEWAEQRKKRTG